MSFHSKTIAPGRKLAHESYIEVSQSPFSKSRRWQRPQRTRGIWKACLHWSSALFQTTSSAPKITVLNRNEKNDTRVCSLCFISLEVTAYPNTLKICKSHLFPLNDSEIASLLDPRDVGSYPLSAAPTVNTLSRKLIASCHRGHRHQWACQAAEVFRVGKCYLRVVGVEFTNVSTVLL